MAASTAAKYAGSQRFFLNFCESLGLQGLPASELTLSCFVGYLKRVRKIGPDAIRGYLAAIKALHTLNNFENPFSDKPRFSLVKTAALKVKPTLKERLPVTLHMLATFHDWTISEPSYPNILFTACAFLAFFGFLRVSEFTALAPNSRKRGLRLSNVDLRSDRVELTLLDTKTDKSEQGTLVVVAKQGSHPCPVRWLAEFIRRRPTSFQDDFLFVEENNSPISAVWFRDTLKTWCERTGQGGNYNTHSLRIGGATAAWAAGLSEGEIQRLGRWTSRCFMRYIKPNTSQLTALNRKITFSSPPGRSTKQG